MTDATTGTQPTQLPNITWLTELPSSAPWLGDPLVTEFAAALRANPSLWAQWPISEKDPHQRGANIRKGNSVFPRGQYEAVTRQGKLYVRYVGKPSPADPPF